MTQKGINPFMFLMSIKVLRRFEYLIILGVFAAIIIRDGYKDKIVIVICSFDIRHFKVSCLLILHLHY